MYLVMSILNIIALIIVLFKTNLNKVMKTFKTFLIILLLLVFNRVNSAIVIINQLSTSFSPSTISLNVGDVIRWVWSSGIHSTTSISVPDGAMSWDGSLTASSSTFEYTVAIAGNYTYHCKYHEGMDGSFTTSDITSVEENRLNDFKIFPNPTTSIVNLPEGLKGKIQLYNILGREVIGMQTIELTGVNLDQLDVSDLVNGIYFIGYFPENTKKRITWRLIKK